MSVEKCKVGYICVKVDNPGRFRELDKNQYERCVFIPPKNPLIVIRGVGYVFVESFSEREIFFSNSLDKLAVFLIDRAKKYYEKQLEDVKKLVISVLTDLIRELENLKWGIVSEKYQVVFSER